ncbi:Ankyrin repeat protein 1 [Giardia duodenalis]|uniref:Ankyrin repeat protein 1 n=1 Tax=Giardia intestinalis (strain ATCC 50803 / WB clone C6) TaxID=184922 RepID=A8BQL4_GIAIC|nr:Ankyrin repeat protein 1 [Giardia intestinalis]KAE8301983.1 Ankyrin repeat protein 1 [Giardia intestinalis]|eukprot:XP_001705551.1 Protein 21.1 [Giardia lamblia ATCC 50803]
MSSADDLGQLLQECDCAPPLMPERDTSEEGAGNPTEPSEMDDEGSVDENGVTTLMKAANRNDVKAVKRYIPYQARMVAKLVKAGRKDISGGTALMVAAVLGHTRVVKLLMRCESGMRSSNGWTALMWAAHFGRTEVVRLLLDAEGGMQKGRGFTALVLAAGHDHLECVKLLLEKEKDIGGVHAIRTANRWNHSEVASFLESEGIVDPYLQMQPRKLVSELAYLLIISQCLPCFTEISLLVAVQVNPPCESPP